jgi:hypothetical protein
LIGNIYIVVLKYPDPAGNLSDTPAARPFLPKGPVFAVIVKYYFSEFFCMSPVTYAIYIAL